VSAPGRETASRPQERVAPGSDYLRFVPFRVPSSSTPAPHLSEQSTAYLEFPPSSRHRRSRPLRAQAAKPTLCSALRFSQPLDGLLRPRLHGLVSSRNHVQGSARSGASRLLQPAHLIGDPCPPAVGPATLIVPKDNGRAPCPRLRGFDPQEVAFLGFGDQPGPRPLPSSGSVLPQELSLALSFGFPKLSAHEVTSLAFWLTAPVPLQRLPSESTKRPVSRSLALLEVSSLPPGSSRRFTRKCLGRILRSTRLPTLRDE
jgi:hypothetical protein